ncbi:hypothetical protein BR93DRAFT_752448 [Coniochaeta sp. PMI_546]|nr:hypothetical protein BR93DRAFT_752448 [Coniochaeta sp. PMI_546]
MSLRSWLCVIRWVAGFPSNCWHRAIEGRWSLHSPLSFQSNRGTSRVIDPNIHNNNGTPLYNLIGMLRRDAVLFDTNNHGRNSQTLLESAVSSH